MEENFVKNKEKTAGLLCNIYHSIQKWMIKKVLTDKEITRSDGDVVLKLDADYFMDKTHEQPVISRNRLSINVRQKQLKFLGYSMRKEGLEN